jgi:uncharacterized BrkB/YihY/UPF0761 family membrane protein
MPKPPPSRYRAKPGQEDRHGEMTGAISFNMMLSMPPVAIWAIFIGPWLFDRLLPTLLIAVAMAGVLPVALRPISQRLWARFSDWSEDR